MFMGVCAIAFLALAVVLGGDLRRLGSIRIRCAWLIFVALVVQVFVIELLPTGDAALGVLGHDLTYVAAVGIALANVRLPGMALLGLGTFSNGLAIVVNGGTLPASRTAIATAHIHKAGHGIDNSGVVAHAHLAWLGDVFNTPSFLPLRNTMSVGDVLILAGAAWMVLRTAQAWPWRRTGEAVGADEPQPQPEPGPQSRTWSSATGFRAVDVLPI